MAKNNTQSKKAEEECKSECSSCATASSCSSAKKGQAGLPPKAAIDVKHVIMVLSGKGGVGKSTVSVNLAFALSAHGKKVGLLDLDMHGPNVPKMLGIEDHKLAMSGNRIEPVHVTGMLSVLSMAFLLPKDGVGMSDMLSSLNAGAFSDALAGLKQQQVKISLPKFKFSYFTSLNDTLKALGMKAAFSDSADFSAMTDGPNDLFVSEDRKSVV